MNSTDRERVKELLCRAARLPSQERAAFIEQAAGADRQIAAEALDLLATLDDSAFMSAPTGAGLTATLSPSAALHEGPGTRIGRYKLLQLIGEGGFGSVFMAEQTEPVVRRVALKIIKAGMDTKQVIARFEAERQALALMDHPNIARVLDAGATDSDRPYFVMELVRGEPVTAYCDRERLSVHQRLELFRDVCHAVQHAHQKGIIHRDLQPTNVLVTVADSEPLPKVIDFGIAKATAGRLTDKTLFTEIHQLIGTPQYMSPEQAEVSGVDIDTRSDVYSLGVLLYELLSGTTPLEGGRLRSMPLAEIQRVICEEEPPRPSLRLATLAVSSGHARFRTPPETAGDSSDSSAIEIARRRRSEPALLTRALRGDLDWIVMKCLEKDRRRRYATASAVADDIARYLTHQPVLATPPSAGYKLRKFARRNRGTVFGGGALLLTLIFGLTTSLAYWRQAEAARVEEARQRRRAEATNQFVMKALQTSDPHTGGTQDMRVTDSMLRALEEIEAGAFDDDPTTAAAILNTIAVVLDGNARSAEALAPARQAVALLRQATPADDAELARSITTEASVLQSLGNSREAEPLLREALALRRRRFDGDHPEVATGLQELATTLRALGRAAEAEPLARDALAMRQRWFQGDHADVAASLNNLANVERTLGRIAEAEAHFRTALEMRQRLHPGDHPDVAQGLNNLAFVLQLLDRNPEAEPLYREALSMRQRLFKGDHPAVYRTLNNLGSLLQTLGRNEEAEAIYRDSLAMRERLNPGDHPDTATALNNLGFVLRAQRRGHEAEPFYRGSLAMRQRLFKGDHPETADSLDNLARLLGETDRIADAEPLCRDGLAMRRRLARGDSSAVAYSLNTLTSLLLDIERPDEAEQAAREALAIHQRVFPGDHRDVAISLNRLADSLHALGRWTDALANYNAAIEMSRRVLPPDHPDTLSPQIGCAETLMALGRHADAERLLRDAAEQCERSEASRRLHWRSVLERSVELYDAWHAAEPDQGHDAEAAEWRDLNL